MKLLFACLCACTCFFPAQGKPAGDFVNVAKYGAIANDGKDEPRLCARPWNIVAPILEVPSIFLPEFIG